MKSREGEPGGCSAVRGEYRHAARRARVDGDERASEKRSLQVAARQLMIEVAGKAVVSDKDVRFAAEAPAQGCVRAGAGAGPHLRQ